MVFFYHFSADDTQLILSFPFSDTMVCTQILVCLPASCLEWQLKIHPSLTELLYISKDAALCQDLVIFLDNSKITPSGSDLALGKVWTTNLYCFPDSAKLTQLCSFFPLHNSRKVQPFLYRQTSQALDQSLVSSCLKYCKLLPADLPLRVIPSSLQLIQNAGSSLVFNHPQFSHSVLPPLASCRFKTSMLACKLPIHQDDTSLCTTFSSSL